MTFIGKIFDMILFAATCALFMISFSWLPDLFHIAAMLITLSFMIRTLIAPDAETKKPVVDIELEKRKNRLD